MKGSIKYSMSLSNSTASRGDPARDDTAGCKNPNDYHYTQGRPGSNSQILNPLFWKGGSDTMQPSIPIPRRLPLNWSIKTWRSTIYPSQKRQQPKPVLLFIPCKQQARIKTGAQCQNTHTGGKQHLGQNLSPSCRIARKRPNTSIILLIWHTYQNWSHLS
jgi:hypothetical protein